MGVYENPKSEPTSKFVYAKRGVPFVVEINFDINSNMCVSVCVCKEAWLHENGILMLI